MKVVIVGSRLIDSLEQHLCDSFRVLGHSASLLDIADGLPVSSKINYWVSRFVEFYDRAISKTIADKIIKLRPDLVVIVYRYLHPILVEQLKKQLGDVLIVQMNPDPLSNLEKQQIIATDFDYYFSKEPYIVDTLRHKAGLNAHYLPEGFNQRIHQKPPIEKAVAEWLTDIDVLVFGNLYAYRARMIEQLMRAGVKVKVYGTQGPYLRPEVSSIFQQQYLVGQEKNRLLYGAKIVFNNFHYAEVSSVNQKYFEINGIGAFQLCDYKSTIDDHTGVPPEQVTYRTIDDAIDKIRYYLARPDKRHELAKQQYTHFQQHHTFDQRVTQLLQTIGLAPLLDSEQVQLNGRWDD
ncbi:glycosyltransferase [Spirosoma sp. HMF4905]|uniref:Glycosyltransferase n=1 Tax=Spirosoma arboris TaxID=2682092 RepID=A0A7K1S617_9BACT|nr:glycosyltransferase [Spirosoma arboris]MVM29263.1 glycosyltransferase [Spirosoma arboris]